MLTDQAHGGADGDGRDDTRACAGGAQGQARDAEPAELHDADREVVTLD